MKKMYIGRREAIYMGIVAAAVLFLILGNRFVTGGRQVFGRDAVTESVPAKVDLILARDTSTFSLDDREYENVTVYFEATITGGHRRGQRISAEQINDPLIAYKVKAVEEGDRIMLCHVNRSGGEGMVWTFQEYDRTGPLLALGAAFFLLLLLFGGKKGLGTMVALTFTCIAIFFVFVPAILSGHNIILWAWLVCFYIVAVTLPLVNGLGVKSLAAGVGTLGGLLMAGGLYKVMDIFLKLTGMADEDAVYLTMLRDTAPIDLKAIIFASILIAQVGAALDVGVSIASSLSEVRRASGASPMMEMVRSGINVGRDILGTMTNTLILVYIGSSLSLTLLLVVYSNSFLELINREAIVIEILQALVGIVGLVGTIPLTAVSYSFLVSRNPNWDWDL